MHISLTEKAHDFIAGALHTGAGAIDTTVGNGHDTAFLARQVGTSGRVFAFDIQPRALEKARKKMIVLELQNQIDWICGCHSNLTYHIPIPWRGKIHAVMFNLGYLPGGHKEIVTQAATTIAALSQAVALLSQGGHISIIAYTGHPGGHREAEAVADWLATQQSDRLSWQRIIPHHQKSPPQLFLIKKS